MKFHQIIIAISIVALLSACTIPAKIEIFNNTGLPITIIIDQGKKSIAQNKRVSFYRHKLGSFTISIGKKTLYYKIEELPLSNIVFVGWGPFVKRVFHSQIEKDGKIWAVGPEQKYPALDFINQPKGFPVEPREVQQIN